MPSSVRPPSAEPATPATDLPADPTAAGPVEEPTVPRHEPAASGHAPEAGDDDHAPEAGDDEPPGAAPTVAGTAGPRRFGTVALALAVAVGLLLGYAMGWLAPRLTAPGDDSVEAGFARDMISHHAQAVEMGLIAFRGSDNGTVRQLAVDVATSQQGELGMMYAWLADWGVDPTRSGPPMAWMPADMRSLTSDGLMRGMASAEEIARLRDAAGREQDVLFLQLMIRHHLGGVHMLDAVLELTDRAEVVDAAQIMKNVQDRELDNLSAALAELGGAPLPAN